MQVETNQHREIINAHSGVVAKLVGTAVFALLTIVGANIKIPLPFTPVPLTLQTFFVPLAGAFLGAYWGIASMLLYLSLGIVTPHVFAAATAGPAFIFAPTAGYLLGYVLAAGAGGLLTEWKRSVAFSFPAIALSHAIIFFCGVIGLMLNAHYSLSESIAKGVLPFLPGDAIKIIASAFVFSSYLVWISPKRTPGKI